MEMSEAIRVLKECSGLSDEEIQFISSYKDMSLAIRLAMSINRGVTP